jgi:hypothetical protein
MIDVLHEHRVRPARREYANRFRGHRPAGQPLHRGAETVGAAIDQMIDTGLQQQAGYSGTTALHLAVAEARIIRFMEGAQPRGQCKLV